MKDDYKEPSVCDDYEIGDGGNVIFVVVNAMKIMVSVQILIAIRWIYDYESHDSSEKGEII